MIVEDPFDETRVFLVCLAIGAALGLLASLFGGQTVWAIAVWTVIVALLVNNLWPCTGKMCFITKSALSVILSAVLSAGISAFAYRCVGDAIATFQSSFAPSFTITMTLLVIIMGFDEWDRYTLALPYCLILLLAAVRALIVKAYGTLICCIDKKYIPLPEDGETDL